MAIMGGSASAAPRATCGDLSPLPFYNIETRSFSCSKARQVVRQWVAQCAGLRTGSCLVTAGFYCRYRSTGYERGAIRCTPDADLERCPPKVRRYVAFVTAV